MPKVNLIFKPNCEAVTKNITKLLIDLDMDKKTLADGSFMCYSTLCYKLKNTPRAITVEELARMAHKLNVPIAVLLEGVM